MKFKRDKVGNYFYKIIIGIVILVILAFLISWWNHHTLSFQIVEATKADVKGLMLNNNTSTETSSQVNDNYCKQSDNINTIVYLQIAILKDSTVVYKNDTLHECKRYSIESSKLDNAHDNYRNKVNSRLDILTKSNNLVGANELTFFFTFIVAVLSIFFGYKTIVVDRYLMEFNRYLMEYEQIKNENKTLRKEVGEKLSKMEEEAIQTKKLREETKSDIIHSVRFDRILTSVASIYSLGIMIGNSTMGLSSAKSKKTENINTCEKVGVLCSRLSLTCAELIVRLNDKDQRLEFLTQDEKRILDTYLADTFGELTRSMDCAERVNIKALSNIITNRIDVVEEIKDTLNRVEIHEEIV